ncbi:MAG: Na+/H+ antiporter NhaC family protein [Candidatus Sericytochromatia bacterium]|nr:Na+/H+ antiporter NhaC family protein [Candidatus Sericytochromatia bacterium]
MLNQRLKVILTLGIFCLVSFFLWQAKPDHDYLNAQQFKLLLDKQLKHLEKAHPQQSYTLDPASVLPATEMRDLAQKALKKQTENLKKAQGTPRPLRLSLQEGRGQMTLVATPSGGKAQSETRTMTTWLSVLPPLVAVVLALLLHRLVLALFAGLFFGALIFQNLNPITTLSETFGNYLWHAVSDAFHIKVIIFAAVLVGMVGVMNASGGTRGIVDVFRKYTGNRRSAQMIASIMGICIFFDDYANSFIIGGTMRPVTDKLKISREKLAYIVDSTAAPVAGLAIISTWIGYEVGLFQEVLTSLDVKISGYSAFLSALPFRFYCIFTLVLVFLLVWMRRDFGPMYHAERRAIEHGLVIRDGAVPMTSGAMGNLEGREDIPARWYNAVLPVLLVIAMTIVGLYVSGGGWAKVQAKFSNLWSFQVLSDSFSSADSATVLLYASIAGSLLAIFLAWGQRLLSFKEVWLAWGKGTASVWLACLILVMAWGLNGVSQDLGTASFLVSIFKDLVHPIWIPMLIFLLAAAIAFSTGSSWSTMAILIPMAVPLAYELGGVPLMIIAMGAVLDGSIFGDHCSPLADTTILSSMACSSDHIDHVRTQMPYALLGMGMATVVGYLPAALGLMPFISILLGCALMWLVVKVVGRNPEAGFEQKSEAEQPAPSHLKAEPVIMERYSQE